MSESKAHSAGDGSFEISDLPKGRFAVSATYAGFPEAEVSHVPADSTSLKIQFKPEGVVSGVAAAQGGKPVVDYTIVAIPSGALTEQQKIALIAGGSQKQTV